MFSTPRTPSAAATPWGSSSGSGLRARVRGGGVGGLNKSSMLGTPSAALAASTSLNASITSAAGAGSAALSSSGLYSLQMVASSAPVLVTEILTAAESPSDVSVCLSPNGWAWLVHGRRLLIWRYQHQQQQQQQHPARAAAALGLLTTCRELTLPPSDLAHAARLVNVFSPAAASGSEGANHTPSCIAISPEGIIRFWPSIAHESASVESIVDLQGQECYSLTDLQPLGSVLATTTSTVVLVSPANDALSVVWRTLKAPQGLLGGIGRRVSTLIWGGAAAAGGAGGGGGGEAKLVQVVTAAAPRGDDSDEKSVFVLTASHLQRWAICDGAADPSSERLAFDCDVETMAKEAFASPGAGLWAASSSSGGGRGSNNPAWLRLWMLDMQLYSNKGELAILIAAANPQAQAASNVVHYAIATVSTRGLCAPAKFASFNVLDHTRKLPPSAAAAAVESESADDAAATAAVTNYRLVLPAGSRTAYIYSEDSIMCAPVVVSGDGGGGVAPVDVIDLNPSTGGGGGGNEILGAGSDCNAAARPIFFTALYGLVNVAPVGGVESANQSSVFADPPLTGGKGSRALAAAAGNVTNSRLADSLNLSVSAAGLDDLTMSESKGDQLKAAFLLFCKRSMGQSVSIVAELFPASDGATASTAAVVDSALDRLVANMSQDLIEDFPASDPRWMESAEGVASASSGVLSSVGTSTSLLILHQLRDKQTAHDFYINFLKEVGLWDRMSSVTVRGAAMPTSVLLLEHAEKIAAAVALRSAVHAEHQTLVDRAIRAALADRENGGRAAAAAAAASGPGSHLTPQDHFYCQISRIGDIFSAVLRAQDEAAARESPREAVRTFSAANDVVAAVMAAALDTRKRRTDEFASPAGAAASRSPFERLLWTSDPSPGGARTALAALFRATAETALPMAEDARTKGALCKQMVQMADYVLDGYRDQLASLSSSEGGGRKEAVFKAYEKDRAAIVGALIDAGFVEEAASLAEKYYDFVGLIKICEGSGDRERLDRYMEQFSGERFADFVFDWHVRQGKQGKLLAETERGGARADELAKFLEGHDGIAWLHGIHAGDYVNASTTLRSLAQRESELLSRKKTMLSLSKLAALASDERDEHIATAVEALEHEWNVVAAQEQLPRGVLDEYGFDAENMRVFTPRELVELYIGKENSTADQIDFKKALDLVAYVGPEDGDDSLEDLRLRIWSSAISRDDWPGMDVDNPVDAVKDTLFFRLAEFCYLQGSPLPEVLPDIEAVFSSPDLDEDLASDANFRFFMRTGYEHMLREEREAKAAGAAAADAVQPMVLE